MKHFNLELHIANLVIDDTITAGRHEMAGVIEQNLARIINEQGLPAGVNLDTFALGSIVVQAEPRATSASIGAQIAQSIYTQLVSNGNKGD